MYRRFTRPFSFTFLSDTCWYFKTLGLAALLFMLITGPYAVSQFQWSSRLCTAAWAAGCDTAAAVALERWSTYLQRQLISMVLTSQLSAVTLHYCFFLPLLFHVYNYLFAYGKQAVENGREMEQIRACQMPSVFKAESFFFSDDEIINVQLQTVCSLTYF